ncbi:MAG: hypothetical protein QOH06_2912 [Acidobacteriota bacterium]|jgi:hypothetical protein|nr:hypothetical protein [Acidobacteriota bacterium]
MSEDVDLPTKLGSVISSLYYDLIARVCAGVPLLALLFWQRREFFTLLVHSPAVAFLLLLGAGYIAGLLLTPFSFVWSFPLLPFFNARFGLPKASISIDQFKAETSASSGAALMSTRNDRVAAIDPAAGATLAKMQAEAILCKNLTTAFVLLVVVDLLGLVDVPALNGASSQLLISGFILLWFAALHRTAVYLGRQNLLYKILVETALEVSEAGSVSEGAPKPADRADENRKQRGSRRSSA